MKKMRPLSRRFLCIAGVCIVLVFGVLGGAFRIGPLAVLNEVPKMVLPGNAREYSMDRVSELPGSLLKGKNVLFLGSSVTYGAFSLQEGIPEYFAARLGCESTKEAVSGTTLADKGKDSYVQRLLRNVDPETPYSLVICQLSTNDAHQNIPLGEITEGFQRESFDTATTTGAIEFIIAYARETWDCPVVFYTNCRFESDTYPAMMDRIKELQQKWDIGLLNLWDDEAFNTLTDEERSLFMADAVHPTRAGYRDWWCPELERQLMEFLSA